MHQRGRKFALCLMAAIGLLAGCSSSGGGSSSSTSQSGVGGNNGQEIRIGTIGSYTGSFPRLVGGARSGIQAWAGQLNANGGINGRKIKLYVMDDKGDAATALTQAKTLINEDHVVALVGEQSQNGAPWISYVTQQGIPVIGGNTNDVPAMTDPDFFNPGGNLLAVYYGVAQIGRHYGTSMGMLYCAESPACAATSSFVGAFGKQLGLSVGYTGQVSGTAPDYTAQCQGLRSAGVGTYSLGMDQRTLTRVVNQCRQQGLSAHLVLPDVTDDTLPKDPAFDGAQVVSTMVPTFDESIPATKQFHDALHKYAPEVGGSTIGLDAPVLYAYASGKLFEAAVKASGKSDITPETIKKGMYSLRGETLGGLTMPLTFTPGKPSPGNCYFSYAVSSGKYIAPNGIKPTCVDPSLLAPIVQSLKK